MAAKIEGFNGETNAVMNDDNNNLTAPLIFPFYFYRMIRSFFFCALLLAGMAANAQQDSVNRDKIQLPDIPGYLTLKCDFHLHTVFSDGHVWPSFRVQEAIRDGLDVISLTEHIDFEGYPDELKRDKNASYRIALETARNSRVLVVPGVEISPRVPPYHNNALFVTDANALPCEYMQQTRKEFVMKPDLTRKQLMAPFLVAQQQGAFVFYNHPNYHWWDGKSRELFTDIHQELLQRGILGGVEVVNSNVYNIIAHRMAVKYQLAMLANADEHYDVSNSYAGTHRPVTLVFATHKTPAGVKEALMARRTAVYLNDNLIGRTPEMEAFFKAAVQVKAVRTKQGKGEPVISLVFTNNSDIPFAVQLKSDYDTEKLLRNRTTLAAHAVTKVILKAVWEYPAVVQVNCTVENILVSPDDCLQARLNIPLE